MINKDKDCRGGRKWKVKVKLNSKAYLNLKQDVKEDAAAWEQRYEWHEDKDKNKDKNEKRRILKES